MRCGNPGSAAVLLSALLFAVAAEATPTTYYLVPGPGSVITTVQVSDVSPPITTTPCPIGSGNCLANSPVAITGALVTVDLDTNQLLDLQIEVGGSMTIDLGGFNGYEQIDVNDVSFQMGSPTMLTASGSQYNFAAPGSVSASSLEFFFTGNTGTTPDAVLLDYGPATTTPTGSIRFGPDGVSLTVTGVDLGVFTDPLTGGNAVLAKADFTFTGAIPEPSAAATFVLALLVGGAAARKLGGKSGARTQV